MPKMVLASNGRDSGNDPRTNLRGVRKRPAGFELPVGCNESAWRRLREEWRLVWRILRDRCSERERELGILSQDGKHVPLHVLRSRRAVRGFLDGFDGV